jgi:hypothetical protein
MTSVIGVVADSDACHANSYQFLTLDTTRARGSMLSFRLRYYEYE